MSKLPDTDVAGHYEDAQVIDFDEVQASATGGHSASELPKGYYKSPKFIGSMMAFFIASGTVTTYLIMISTAINIINADIGPSDDYIWVLLAVTLGQSVTFPIAGRLSDLFGRRWFFIGANALAFIGLMVGSRAQTINTLIAGNVIVGVGSAVQISGTAIPGELVPNDQRFLLFTILAGSFGPILALSPGISRAFCDHTEQSWRWILYFQAILVFIALLLFIFCYFPPRFEDLHKRSSKMETLKNFDYVGAILYAGSAISFLLGLSWGGQQYPWKSAHCIAPIVIGLLGLIALVFYERFAKLRYPFFDVSILLNRNWALLTLCSSVGSMIFYALNILWPEQLEILFKLSSTNVGWASCTLPSGVMVGWYMSGPIITLTKLSIKYQLLASALILTTFIGAMAACNGTNLALGIVFSLIGGIGIGYLENVTIVGGPLHLDAKDIGLANGLQYSIRTIMSSVASAVFVTILQNQIAANVPVRIVTAAVEGGLSETSALVLVEAILAANSTELLAIPKITPAIIQSATAAADVGFFKSFQVVYYVSLAFGALAILAAISIDGKLFQSKMTTEVPRKLRKIPVTDQDSSMELEKGKQLEGSG